jgi:hypothetical protein
LNVHIEAIFHEAEKSCRFLSARRSDEEGKCGQVEEVPWPSGAWRTPVQDNDVQLSWLPVSPDLLARNLCIEAPNPVTRGHATALETEKGCLYITVVIDLIARQLVDFWLRARAMQDLDTANSLGPTEPPASWGVSRPDLSLKHGCLTPTYSGV